jgi:hypothetical protein
MGDVMVRRRLLHVFSGDPAAVRRLQAAYGLGQDGVAGPQTFTRIYQLQDDDCTPIHFSYADLNDCNRSGFVWDAPNCGV